MNLFLNFGLAWISVLLALLLSIIYVTRILSNMATRFKIPLTVINKKLRRHHKKVGVSLVLTGILHGLNSSEPITSLSLGTICWLISILMGISWMARKSLKHFNGWIFYHRILTVVFIATLIWHIIDVGGIQAHKLLFTKENPILYSSNSDNENDNAKAKSSTSNDDSNNSNDTNSISSEDSTSSTGTQFMDGTFEGEANGFRPGLKVSVDIKNNKITSISIIEHNEINPRFYSTPINVIPKEIINSQNVQVDTISGATFTSIGIMNAVNDALSKALLSGNLPDNIELPALRRH